MDVSPGRDDKVVFIWQKSKEMNELYRQWCEKKPIHTKGSDIDEKN